jgi:hypothetical protein
VRVYAEEEILLAWDSQEAEGTCRPQEDTMRSEMRVRICLGLPSMADVPAGRRG